MFNSIKNEEDAYYLGLLLSDGCASINKNNSKSISLSLNKRDIDTIYRFKNYLNVNNKIQERNNSASISIGSKEMFDNLQKFSCVPRKSLILKFPENIDQNLYCHLIRGYFDGDGCISKTSFIRQSRSKNSSLSFKRTKWEINFAGTFEFLSSIKLIMNIEGCLYKVNKNSKNTYRLSYVHNIRVKKVLNFMYSTATVYMERKYDKAQEFYHSIK